MCCGELERCRRSAHDWPARLAELLTFPPASSFLPYLSNFFCRGIIFHLKITETIHTNLTQILDLASSFGIPSHHVERVAVTFARPECGARYI
jgi:hypothetical protein